ncbi:MAG: class I SAM-dependent methyltransferase [Bacillota bacterium]|nr:class I SAM-dependent methyltransferase [Bacillota bacterium]
MECYKLFSEVYDNLIKNDIDYKSVSDFIYKNIEKGSSFLDLACGTGNLTEKLVPYYKEAYGVDLSCDMLSVASSKESLKAVKFINQDLSELNIGISFDLITCSLDSINYIPDKRKVKSLFKRIYDHLSDKGTFVFDINSRYKLSCIMGNNTFTYEDEDLCYIWDNYYEKDKLYMDLTFFIREGNLYKRFSEQHIERAYTEEFIEKSLKDASLKVIKKTDGWREKKVSAKTERIVYFVKKIA